MVSVFCYNCGSGNYTAYDHENGYNLVKCKGCGLLYVNPRPADGEIDQASLTGMHRGDHLLKVNTRFNAKKIRKYLRILGDFYNTDELSLNSPRWHDIGCGTGEFMIALQEFSENNLTVSGNEPNSGKAGIARKHGISVVEKTPDPSLHKFNFISLLNVYSHLPDPVKTLTEWKELLYPGGELFIETGHSCHLPKNLHHRPYYLPDHLSFASKEILLSILNRIGFEVKEVKIYRGEMYPDNLLDFIKYLGINICRKNINMQNLVPKEPDRDMFIRAVLKK
jgi:SAM-dependent methyltransferase